MYCIKMLLPKLYTLVIEAHSEDGSLYVLDVLRFPARCLGNDHGDTTGDRDFSAVLVLNVTDVVTKPSTTHLSSWTCHWADLTRRARGGLDR